MTNYIIDTHGHYLYGVDDGAVDLEMSLKMIEIAYKQGIREIFCTSHDGYDVNIYKSNLMLLKKYVANKGIDMVLHQGSEIACYERTMAKTIDKLKTGEILPMGKSKYVLMEFSPWTDTEEIIYCVREIRNETVFEPIIAHIERYRWIYDDPMILYAIKGMKIPVQVNAYSFVETTDADTKEFVKLLLEEKLIAFIGSDAHRTDHRHVAIDKGVEYIYEHCDQKYADAICYKNAEELLIV